METISTTGGTYFSGWSDGRIADTTPFPWEYRQTVNGHEMRYGIRQKAYVTDQSRKPYADSRYACRFRKPIFGCGLSAAF